MLGDVWDLARDFFWAFLHLLIIMAVLGGGLVVGLYARQRAFLRYGVPILAIVVSLFIAGDYIHSYVFSAPDDGAQAARTDIVSAFVTLLGGLAIITAAYSGIQNYRSSQENLRVSKDTLRLEQDRETGERFSKAVELLTATSSNEPAITARIGGIYVLEQIAHEWYRRAHSFAQDAREAAESEATQRHWWQRFKFWDRSGSGGGSVLRRSAERTLTTVRRGARKNQGADGSGSARTEEIYQKVAIDELIVKEYEDKYWATIKLLCDYVIQNHRPATTTDSELRRDVEVALDAVGNRPSPLNWKRNGVVMRPNLRGCDFSRIDVTRRNFSGIDLTEACFDEALVWRANFRDAVLRNASFEGAFISVCMFNGHTRAKCAHVGEGESAEDYQLVPGTSADFEGADTEGIKLNGARGVPPEMMPGRQSA